jgi:Domain of unknown function (DUF4145)
MATLPTTFIACPRCDAKVQASVLAEKSYPPGEEYDPFKYVFVSCSQCGAAMVGYSDYEMTEEGNGWSLPIRQWPEPDDDLHANIPRSVRKSLEEAKRCLTSRAYMACAVMCGRAVEALCKDKVNGKTLADGLKKLRTGKIIDEKLYEWSEALRHERNIGAHAGDEVTTWQDARDVLDFAIAISEYVYVLDEKYKAYVKRKPRPKPASTEA